MNGVQLNQAVQGIYQFITPRINNYPGLKSIGQELDAIASQFKTHQLTVQIFSESPLLSAALKNFFTTHHQLNQCYHCQTIDPSNPGLTRLTLVFKGNPAIDQPQSEYPLDPKQLILLGRDLSSSNPPQTLPIPLSSYRKVSGRHAEIKALSQGDEVLWQVCDLHSTNGTYVNGQKITQPYTLQEGDRITLAYPQANEKAPEFLFTHNSNTSTANQPLDLNIQGELVFLGITPKTDFSDNEKQILTQSSQANIFGLIVVVDISPLNLQERELLQAQLTLLESLIKTQYPPLASSLEIISLPLHPFYPNITQPTMSEELEQQLNDFALPFVDLAQNQGQELLSNRIEQKLQEIVAKLEKILTEKENILQQEMQKSQSGSAGQPLDYWYETYTRTKRRTDEEKEDLFRDAKNQFFHAKGDFETDFIPNSLPQKLEAFINHLEPVVQKVDNMIGIQLQAPNQPDLHSTMLAFCQVELNYWGEQQWEKICHQVEGEGLIGLLNRHFQELNSLPEFQLNNPFHIPPIQLDFGSCFTTEFSEAKGEISYAESSGNAFGGIAKIALLTASTAISASMASPFAIIQGMSTMSALGNFVGGSLSQPQQEKLKLEQVVESLRRTTLSHYRNIGRYLLNQVSHAIASQLDAEARAYRKAKEAIDEQTRRYFIELEKIQKGYKIRQDTLNKDKFALEKVKHLVGG